MIGGGPARVLRVGEGAGSLVECLEIFGGLGRAWAGLVGAWYGGLCEVSVTAVQRVRGIWFAWLWDVRRGMVGWMDGRTVESIV